MKEKYHAILGILFIIGMIIIIIVMFTYDVNIITEPLLTLGSLIFIIPIGVYYIIAINKLQKEKRKLELDNE